MKIDGEVRPHSRQAGLYFSFSRGEALRKWADPLLDIPPAGHQDPVGIRLAETQAWVGDKHAVLLNRAIQVNQQSALGVIGQFGIDFFPAYQKLHLHRVALLRGGQTLDRTMSAGTRLLDREANLDAGMYGGAVTLQLLLDDVGLRYQAGEGVEPDTQKAFFYFRIAAERNMVEAQSRLASYYLGETMRDYPKALRWARRAADKGDESAILTLATIYRYGLGLLKDEGRAASLYLDLDKKGSVAASSRLGYMYSHGQGVEQDYSLAFHYYQKAHRGGNVSATNNLADLYEKGHGVTQDLCRGIELVSPGGKGGEHHFHVQPGRVVRKGTRRTGRSGVVVHLLQALPAC